MESIEAFPDGRSELGGLLVSDGEDGDTEPVQSLHSVPRHFLFSHHRHRGRCILTYSLLGLIAVLCFVAALFQFSTPQVLHRLAKTNEPSTANEFLLASQPQSCSGDYGQAVGDPTCCGQQGTIAMEAETCPYFAPICTGLALGKSWGSCVAAAPSPAQDQRLWPQTSSGSSAQVWARPSPSPALQHQQELENERSPAAMTAASNIAPIRPLPGLRKCLCIFDVDRTLTAKQSVDLRRCPGTRKLDWIPDNAYEGGEMVISQLGMHIEDTFCGTCYRGVVTAGTVSGADSLERQQVLELLGGERATLSSEWSKREYVKSSLVIVAQDGRKQESVRDIVSWFETKGVVFEDKHVHFFDDRDGNVPPFDGYGWNARQVSCGSRNDMIGECGATISEIVEAEGVFTCEGKV